EHIVIALLGLELGDAAIRIVGVAKNDGLGGARRLAGGDNFAVANGTILLFGLDARVVDALHTVSAFLHDPAAAHGDFRIAHKLELRRFPILEAQEIEAAHFVRTVVGAVARADTAVVDHVVQAFGTMDRGAYWADLLARSVFALHARNWLEKGFRISERIIVVSARVVCRSIRFVIAVDANPVHFAATQNLVFADDWNVVFRDAGDHAGIAAIATVEINGHTPGVAGILEFLVQRKGLGGSFVV